MHTHKKITAVITCGFVLLTGCSVKYTNHPETFAEVGDVYLNEQESPPKESHLESSYEAAYVDVFQSVTSSLALANLFPVEIDQNQGIILAHRTIKTDPRFSSQAKYFYRIYVTEVDAESTRVDVQSKVQSSCSEQDTGLGLQIASLGIITALEETYDIDDTNQLCVEYWSKPNWTDEPRNDTDTLEKIHQMIRINLVKAGLL